MNHPIYNEMDERQESLGAHVARVNAVYESHKGAFYFMKVVEKG
jgi:hypothetical protein